MREVSDAVAIALCAVPVVEGLTEAPIGSAAVSACWGSGFPDGVDVVICAGVPSLAFACASCSINSRIFSWLAASVALWASRSFSRSFSLFLLAESSIVRPFIRSWSVSRRRLRFATSLLVFVHRSWNLAASLLLS